MKLDLRVRDLKTGSTDNQPFSSVDEAKAWLRERPRFTEVLGVASHHVPAELSEELKALNRPLDEEEDALRAALEARVAEAQRRQREEQRRVAEREATEQREAMKNADPNRPMALRYTFSGGITLTTPGDERPITDEAREAVMAWVAERNEWVKSRGQVVGDANLEVWPGPLPEGESDRIITGTFIPVTGPAS